MIYLYKQAQFKAAYRFMVEQFCHSDIL
ncbi:protein of unknown function [Acidithiobacillus ferrivorans]|uniref:Transposase n=1 Tax=Acidithiobacillus ferrivorans TaxID=160808 RepID=A0ABY1MUV9_9PROT|nr:protein of unknown function [Acidithiobacillus ferrivorans]